MAYTGLYATDGSWNIAVVDGTTYVGSTSVDGALNVFQSAVGGNIGSTAPSGARHVTVSTSPTVSVQANNGSMNISVSPYTNGGRHVTVVSGVLV